MKPSHPGRGAYAALWILSSVNVLNYVDRQILFAVLPLIKTDLGLSDARLGALASAFMLVYMFAAPPIAHLAEGGRRKRWIAGGVAAWSAATLLTGRCRTYLQLFLARAAVGIGESSYGSISPTLVSEHFPVEDRGRVLAYFSTAIPVGSALGYVFGGYVGHHFGWRGAFVWAGLVGLPLAAATLAVKDPLEAAGPALRRRASWTEYAALIGNRSFVLDTLALAAMTFSLGGLAVWMPTFFNRHWGMNVAQAGTLFGTLTVVCGLAGSLLGGWLSDVLLKRTRNAYFIVSGTGLLLSVPFAALALLSRNLTLSIAALGMCELLAFLNMGPLNAVIASVTPPETRTMAFAVNIFAIHALGDAASPALIGLASDLFGLTPALLGTAVFLGLAGCLCFAGTKWYGPDLDRAEAFER